MDAAPEGRLGATARGLAVGVLLAVAAIAAGLVALEIGCRCLVALGRLPRPLMGAPAPTYRWSPRLVRSGDPTLAYELDRHDPLVNALGLRKPEPAMPKPAGTFRILVVGDSVVFGLGVPAKDTTPARLEAALRRGLPAAAPRIDAINAGVSGYGTPQELHVLESVGPRLDPDLVVLVYVLNDPLPGDAVVQLSQQQLAGAGFLAVAERWSMLAAIAMGRLRAGLAVPMYASLHADPQRFAPVAAAFDGFARWARETGRPVVVAIAPLLLDARTYPYAAAHATVRAALARAGLPALDVRGTWHALDATRLRLDPRDDTHPNALGHRLLARSIARFLRARGLVPAPAVR